MTATRFDNFLKVVKSKQIDVIVYHLYSLNYQEACVIDNGKTEVSFERFVIARNEAKQSHKK